MNQFCANTAELSRFEASEAKKERAASAREASIADRVAELTAPGGDYHPWTIQNFQEAIAEASQAHIRIVVALTAAAAMDGNCHNDHSNHFALEAIRKSVETYWHDMALSKAEHEADEAAKYACPNCGGAGCRSCREE